MMGSSEGARLERNTFQTIRKAITANAAAIHDQRRNNNVRAIAATLSRSAGSFASNEAGGEVESVDGSIEMSAFFRAVSTS